MLILSMIVYGMAFYFFNISLQDRKMSGLSRRESGVSSVLAPPKHGCRASPAALGGASAASRFSGEDDTAALSLRDCAALAPGDSPVVLVELTGAELRQWLDRSAEAYQAEPDGSISGGEGADVLYGMDYALYLGASEGQRVDGLAFEGALVDDGQTFRVWSCLSGTCLCKSDKWNSGIPWENNV